MSAEAEPMARKSDPCPNCGSELIKIHTARSRNRHRAVALEWMICLSCRHVALKSWSIVDDGMSKRETDSGRDVLSLSSRVPTAG